MSRRRSACGNRDIDARPNWKEQLTRPAGPHLAYEIKHDGFRFICRRDGDRVRVFSRRGNDWTARLPNRKTSLSRIISHRPRVPKLQPVHSNCIDGERLWMTH